MEYKKLKELNCEFLSGFAFKSSEFSDNGIPVIKIGNIQNNRVSIDRSVNWFPQELVSEKIERFLLENGDVLIAMTGQGSVGRVGKLILGQGETALLNQRVGRFICDEINLNKEYLFYVLTSNIYQDFLFNTGTGSGQPNLSPSVILETEIPAPPYKEQRAIASVLSSLDDKIDLLHRQNQTLEAMAETLFRQWFVEEAEEGWEEKPLKEVLSFVVDNRGKTAPTAENGIPLIATNCVKNQTIFPVYEKVRFVSDNTYKNWFRSHPEPGDIIFVNKGTPGCVNLVPNPVDFCIAQDMIALRVNEQLINNYYLFLYFRTKDIQSLILNSSVGTTIPHLKKTDLLEFPVLLPDNLKLEAFNMMVSPFFFKMNANRHQIRTLTTLRDTLLPKLMSGEVRVKH